MGPIKFIDNAAYPDMGMPVDLRMIESPKFGNTYKEDDFLGTYESITTTLQGGVGGNSGTSTIQGVLKGYGYVSYSSEGVGPSFGSPSWGVSSASGSITGKATKGNENFTPAILAGWGSQISTSASLNVGLGVSLGVEYGSWWSFDKLKDAKKNNFSAATFTGVFKGVVVGGGVGSNANGTASKQVTNTTQRNVTVTYCTNDCQ